MKKKVILISLIVIVLVVGVFVLISFGNNDSNTNKNYKNTLEGTYILTELSADNTTYTAKEWKEMTTMEYSIELKNDKTAIRTLSYKENMDVNAKETKEVEYYTYDEKYLYGTNNEGTLDGKKYFSYEYNNGMLKLIVLDDTHNSIFTYQKN